MKERIMIAKFGTRCQRRSLDDPSSMSSSQEGATEKWVICVGVAELEN